MATGRHALFLSVVALALGTSAVGCPCVKGAVNDSPSLRWWLFSNFGAQKVCPEVLKRGVPLKLQALGSSSIGRFFPQQCSVVVNDTTHTMIVNITGSGYASTEVTKRVGFYCGMSVEYRPDFRFEGDSMYVWGMFNRLMSQPDLRILGVENPLVNLATQTPVGSLATMLGQGIVTSEIGRGFTVVRQEDGDDFAMGILAPPEKPKRQFVSGTDHMVLASDVSEIRPQAREYLGPFEVPGNGQALFFKFRNDGSPIVSMVVDKQTGDAWRQSYETAQPLGPPPGALLGSTTLQPGLGSQTVPLAKGQYYLVLENQQAAGFAPLGMPIPFTNAPTTVSYSTEVGDRP
jgi:hypothetical protein